MLVREMYRALELVPGAGTEEIRGAYRRLVKIHHPDLGGTSDRFARIMEAYEGLMKSQPRVVRRQWPAASSASGASSASSTGSRTADLFELGSRAMTAPDPADRAFACRTLGQTGLKTALAFLKRALLDRSQVVRIAAARALVQLGTRGAISALCEQFPRLDGEAQLAVLESVAAMDGAVSELYRPAVVDALATGQRELRRVALGLYARINRGAGGRSA